MTVIILSTVYTHFRNLLAKEEYRSLLAMIASKILEQSQSWQQQHLLKALELCNKVDLNYKMSKNQRLLVEIALMQICGVKEDNTTVEKNLSLN